MIRIVLCGIAGRMGQEVVAAARDASDIAIVAGVERPEYVIPDGKICGVPVAADLSSVLDQGDCLIDFTASAATIANLKTNQAFRRPCVIGTTGFTAEEMATVTQASESFAIVLAPNMAPGVNLLYDLAARTAAALPGYDVEIVETHHRAKKDAPSGTALALVKTLQGVRPELRTSHGRTGETGARAAADLGVHAVRGGDVVGEHRVLFLGKGEIIELRHWATSRRCFAEGALAAARFVSGKRSGLFTMQHVLKG